MATLKIVPTLQTLEEALEQANKTVFNILEPGGNRQALLGDIRNLASVAARDQIILEEAQEKKVIEARKFIIALLANSFASQIFSEDLANCLGNIGFGLAEVFDLDVPDLIATTSRVVKAAGKGGEKS